MALLQLVTPCPAMCCCFFFFFGGCFEEAITKVGRDVKSKEKRVTQSKPEAETKAKNGTSLFPTQNRVIDVHNTLAVCMSAEVFRLMIQFDTKLKDTKTAR